ncbi:hypothetical protein TUM4644_00270 [Shewanella colwelliana]|uniref:Uncharacterized protein n=1 Tax=Shewanella colwelliana TaxID=23 RepID=A0A1E5IRP5_SHECO|nr:hypothetical protein BEL05_13215 [Shewanella colwelliana]GIU16318.1 hypothetical protein TUM4644_00270 [Shewanella colwelliana]GIU38669.1 hypothetical protein TUM3794_11510 [Shewanella colwelliana]
MLSNRGYDVEHKYRAAAQLKSLMANGIDYKLSNCKLVGWLVIFLSCWAVSLKVAAYTLSNKFPIEAKSVWCQYGFEHNVGSILI